MATFDQSGCRLITAEADKTIKIYKEDESAVSGLASFVGEWYDSELFHFPPTSKCVDFLLGFAQLFTVRCDG